MAQNQPYDDVLVRAGNVDSALTRGVHIARERARIDAPVDFCAMCVDDTPLAYANASDVHTVRFMDRAVDAVCEKIERIDGPLTDKWWVRSIMVEAYREAYFGACAEPAECEVCTNRDHYDECGHDRHGEECPAEDT